MSNQRTDLDEKFFIFATPRQREVLEAIIETGSQARAAEKLGVGHSTVSELMNRLRARAARQGYSPGHDMTRTVPDGFRMKGTSTLYDADGKVTQQWVKSTIDHERQAELLREMVAGFTAELPRYEPIEYVGPSADDLLAVYPVGDHHIGMSASRADAGDDYNIEAAKLLLARAFGRLTAALPAGGTALVSFLGDLFHYDGMDPVTPTHKNLLDADGRYAAMVKAGIKIVRHVLALVLERHETVHVIVQAGNHDPSSAIFLAECLAAVYENEPRITIDTSPRQFHYFEHGRNLVGVCHGHEVKKLTDLPIIMAQDRPEAWGRTRYRTWLTGHVHSDRVVDASGVRVESFRVLPPTDAWADSHGYRGAREMKALLLHAAHGEVQRVTVNPEMFV